MSSKCLKPCQTFQYEITERSYTNEAVANGNVKYYSIYSNIFWHWYYLSSFVLTNINRRQSKTLKVYPTVPGPWKRELFLKLILNILRQEVFFRVAGSLAKIGFSPNPTQNAKVSKSQSLAHLVQSKMIIFKSLLTTFEASSIFWVSCGMQ